jgi:hypothetical protein
MDANSAIIWTEKIMFKRRPARELELPPMAASNAQAFEVLRAWTAPGEAQEVVLKTTWKNPGTWGLMLADIARHAANAYANEGHDREEALRQIRQMMNAEFADPTDEPRKVS